VSAIKNHYHAMYGDNWAEPRDTFDEDMLHDARHEMNYVAQELIRLADMAKEQLASNPPADGDFPSWAVRNARCAGTLDHIEWWMRQLAERLDKEAK
jgi:hypothetical protein